MSESCPIISIDKDRSSIVIIWGSNHEQRCSSKWLRYNCVCDHCKSSCSPLMTKTESENDLTIKDIDIQGNALCSTIGRLHDNHRTIVPLGFIFSHCNCNACIDAELCTHKVKPRSLDEYTPYVEYDDTLTEEGILSFLEEIIDHGFCVVRNFPTNNKVLLDFARSFGLVRSTLYEDSWWVRSVAQPCNAAYTSFKLPSHQDTVMYESSPGVQFLLAIRFDKEVTGGQTKIVDIIGCAEIFREKYPEHFRTFCRVPVTFHTVDMNRSLPTWIKNTKPHIELDCFDEIVGVNWHPALEGTLRIREADIEPYYSAHKVFMNIVHDPKNQFMFRLETGDLLIVNNHRVAHSREAYTSFQDGDRNLFGFYIEMDDLKSKYMTLADCLGKKISPPKIGSRSSF